ncbi:M91 family zinc metallopeptidase [Dactylosporangium sp. NPDC051541]|uniref:M91 family zinc metallopeptidase n=1 Tax=Dactylosporangium sp. NPDC051541 TaxID=3363977 RepID=UPI0037AE671F
MTPPPAEDATITVDDRWALAARPELLGRAAAGWRAVGADVRAGADALAGAAAPVLGGDWDGAAADGFRRHYRQYADSLVELDAATDATALALDGAAALLRRAQDQLDTAFARAAAVPQRRLSGTVTFEPADAAQVEAVRTAVAEAVAIRADVEQGLAEQRGRLSAALDRWGMLARTWRPAIGRMFPAWTPPPATGELDARLVGDLFVVQAGGGANRVEIGDGFVVVDGQRLTVPAGARLVLRTGGGDDTVRADGSDGVTVLGGDGNDRLTGGRGDDVLIAGMGVDTVAGGAGADRVSLGAMAPAAKTVPKDAVERADLGDGDDRLWGGFGADDATGGSGADFLFGGTADDRLSGGDGDDVVAGGGGGDRLEGGAGFDLLDGGDERDYLDGGAGDDRLEGGRGDDTLYGLDGSDVVRGGEGDDFADGGAGGDLVAGDGGADVVSGGAGDDLVAGGGGDDVEYSGRGQDTVTGGDGSDTLYGQGDDAVTGVERLRATAVGGDLTGFIDVGGDPAYQARVRADLDLLAASATGRAMLEDLRASGVRLHIVPTADANGYASYDGGVPTIQYNPAYDARPPIVTLFHELAHVHDYEHGSDNHDPYNQSSGPDRQYAGGPPVPNNERQAVGLAIDDDGDPGTPNRIDPRHPLQLTENGLRAELGLAPRERYGSP